MSWKRKIFSDVDKWRPENNGGRKGRPRPGCACHRACHSQQPVHGAAAEGALRTRAHTDGLRLGVSGEAVVAAREPWGSISWRSSWGVRGGLRMPWVR